MKRIYIAGDGFLDVFKQSDPDHYDLMERVPTRFRAQTAFLIRELNTYYVAVPHHEDKPAEILLYKCRFRKLWQTDSGNSGRLSGIGQVLFELKVPRPMRGSVELEEPSSLEDSVEDGSSQILVV